MHSRIFSSVLIEMFNLRGKELTYRNELNLIDYNKVITKFYEVAGHVSVYSVSDLPIGYIGSSLRPQDPRGPPKTVARIEPVAGI